MEGRKVRTCTPCCPTVDSNVIHHLKNSSYLVQEMVCEKGMRGVHLGMHRHQTLLTLSNLFDKIRYFLPRPP